MLDMKHAEQLITVAMPKALSNPLGCRHLSGKALKAKDVEIDQAFDFFDAFQDGELQGEEIRAMMSGLSGSGSHPR